MFNSLAPGRFQFNFRYVIFKLTSVNDGWGISYEIALRWMPLDLTDDKSTLVQVMAWCRQATSHYLSQCWPRSMSPNGVTRPQWVNSSHTYLYWCLRNFFCNCDKSLALLYWPGSLAAINIYLLFIELNASFAMLLGQINVEVLLKFNHYIFHHVS